MVEQHGDKSQRVRARVDARGWWRIGPVRIEPKRGENPADRKVLAMKIEACLNGETLSAGDERSINRMMDRHSAELSQASGGAGDVLKQIIARIDAWASIPGAAGASDALMDVGILSKKALDAAAHSASGGSKDG